MDTAQIFYPELNIPDMLNNFYNYYYRINSALYNM